MDISMFATESCNVKACIVDNMSTVWWQKSEYHRQQMEYVNDFDKRTLSSSYKVSSNTISNNQCYLIKKRHLLQSSLFKFECEFNSFFLSKAPIKVN